MPPPIQKYIGDGSGTLVAKRLMTKYGLRIDQGGILEREITLLLMGIETPDEFVKALTEEAQLDRQAVNGITHDVNEQIFVPLRAQMQAGSASERVVPRPVNAQVPRYVPPQLPAMIPANPSMPARAIPQDSPVSATPKYVPPRPPVAPAPRPTAPSLGEVVRAVTPQAAFTPPQQRPYTPPANLPGMMPGVIEPTIIVRRAPVSDTPPPPVPLTPKPPAPSYAADPYHEPIDGPGA